MSATFEGLKYFGYDKYLSSHRDYSIYALDTESSSISTPRKREAIEAPEQKSRI